MSERISFVKIVQLDIQGFRSLKNVSWYPGDLNVVIGPNGSGKSNLLRMLELISAAAQGKLENFVSSSGGINQLSWDGQMDLIEFSLVTLGMSEPNRAQPMQYELGIRTLSQTNDYRIDNEMLTDTITKFESIVRGRSEGAVMHKEENGNFAEYKSSVVAKEETLLSAASSPFSPWGSKSVLADYQAPISNWSIYQDIRTDQNAPVRQAPISRLEQRVSPDGQNLINVLHTLYSTNRNFKQDINDAMFAAFGADFDELTFPPAADQRIQMRVRWKTLKREQSTADLSDGTLRFLFLITVLASPNPPPLIAIDEPETGLHPSMLPIIAEFAVEAATRTQVIFTTHSDQFLSAFRDTRPTVTIAKWENGETTLATLDDSELAYWLKDYSLGKLFRSGELENLAS